MTHADEIDIMHNFTMSLLFVNVINLNVCLSLTVAL